MSAPKSRRFLDIAIDKLGDKYGDPMRIRRAIASTVVAQMLPGGVIKGGSALKLRYGNKMTRFTKDVDAARDMDSLAYIEAFRTRLAAGWNGFTGRIVPQEPPHPEGVPECYIMEPFAVKLDYLTKPWLTVDFELGHNEIGDADVCDETLSEDIVKAFEELGFPKPTPVRLMTVEYQLAQKIHAATEPGNDRARDLVDIQVMVENSAVDYDKLKKLCERIFSYRKRHTWPARFFVGANWPEMYSEARGDIPALPTVEEAIAWANDFIDKIAAS